MHNERGDNNKKMKKNKRNIKKSHTMMRIDRQLLQELGELRQPTTRKMCYYGKWVELKVLESYQECIRRLLKENCDWLQQYKKDVLR